MHDVLYCACASFCHSLSPNANTFCVITCSTSVTNSTLSFPFTLNTSNNAHPYMYDNYKRGPTASLVAS